MRSVIRHGVNGWELTEYEYREERERDGDETIVRSWGRAVYRCHGQRYETEWSEGERRES